MTDLLLTHGRVVTGESIWEDGWVEIRGELIHAMGRGPRTGGTNLAGRLVTPGFVDLHVHGGGGVGFSDQSTGASRRAAALHLRHGTTTIVAGLATRSLDEMVAAAESVVPLVEEGVLAGVFYEGPFLSPVRRGAHSPRLLRAPDPSDLERLLAATRGTVRLVTLAPELPGALDLVRRIVDAGAVAAVGHTDASYEQCVAAFDAGARVATHLFNGMRPLHHRDPGPVAAAIGDDRVVCEIIADGVHLHDATVRLSFDCVGSSRVALVTDAMEGAGGQDGVYEHGDIAVHVRQGRAMLADGSAIAGSTLTMDVALRRAVFDAGVPLHDAVMAATATPARVLGLDGHVGVISPGARADLVVLDEALSVRQVIRGGRYVA